MAADGALSSSRAAWLVGASIATVALLVASIVTAVGAASAYAAAGRLLFAAGAAAIALLASLARWRVIPQMDALRAQIQDSGTDAIPGFRRTHVFGVMVNLVQLVLIVWSLTTFSPA